MIVRVRLAKEPTPRREAYIAAAVEVRGRYIRIERGDYERIRAEHGLSYRPTRRRRWRGLGDAVAWLTAALGIKPCCGCKKRQSWLNRLFPFARRRRTA